MVLFRIILFLVGFGLALLGFVYIISYLNLIALGYNFIEYVKFICRKIECIIGIIGLILISLAIFMPDKKEDNNDLCL